MGSGCDREGLNVEDDRLSSLPDVLIHKILSFIGIEQAIRISVLSSRWRRIWKSMPCLNFSSKDFHDLPKFCKFVKHVLLSRKDNEIEVSSMKLSFRGKASQAFVQRVLKYASSNNVQQLNVTCLHGKEIDFPLSLFSSRALKHLPLTTIPLSLFRCQYLKHLTLTTMVIRTLPAWELPSLATLILNHVTLDLHNENTDKGVGLFSNCANLKDLTLKNCGTMGGLNKFNISHPGLSHLTLEDGCERVDVVAPQLKNLTIKYWRGIHLTSTPNLSTLNYKGYDNYMDVGLLQFYTDLLHLEKVDCCLNVDKADPCKILCLLWRFHSVKFLTLNLELVKVLSSFIELISRQPSPFANLKSLKIYPVDVSLEDQTEAEVTLSTKVKNFLLDGSPGATFTLISHEEIRAVKNVVLARDLMNQLQELLDQWKENSETKTDDMKRGKASTESHMATTDVQAEVENHSAQPCRKMESRFQERMTHIESYWEDFNEQLEKGYKNTRRTIAMMRKIEMVLEKVPISDRAKLQAQFSGLCAEAQTMMDNVIDCMKIQCDKKPSLSNVFFHEPATSL